MQNTSARARFSRREGLAYAQITAFVLFLIAVAVIVIFIALPRPEWVNLGTTEELANEVPTRRALTLSDGTNLVVWVVHTDNQLYVFNADMPFGTQCRFEWQPVTGRFEDPCLGAKFTLTREFIDRYTAFAGRTVRNLDRYDADIRGDHLYIDARQLIRGEPFVARALTPGALVR